MNPYSIGSDYWACMHSLEPLFLGDWTLDHEECSFPGPWDPEELNVGCLVEYWEQPAAQTVTPHVREGDLWQDKPPLTRMRPSDHESKWTGSLSKTTGVNDTY